MELTERITQQFEESGHLKLELAHLLANPILRAAELIVEGLLNEKKVLTCGNGGSAATAQYFASLMVNQFQVERPSLAAISLACDTSTLTAIANHDNFDQFFSKQIIALGQSGDILLALSASGNSKNILRAIKAAKERNMHVIALSGGDGGKMVELLHEDDIHIGVPHDSVARVQEAYILIMHCLCDAIDCILLGVH